jgi:hypothetical protein
MDGAAAKYTGAPHVTALRQSEALPNQPVGFRRAVLRRPRTTIFAEKQRADSALKP